MSRRGDRRDPRRGAVLGAALLAAVLGTSSFTDGARVVGTSAATAATFPPAAIAASAPIATAASAPIATAASAPFATAASAPIATAASAPLATAASVPLATAASVPLAAESPFASGSASADEERRTEAEPSTARLDRLAAVLRRQPLAVDPELDWMFDAATRRSLERSLGGARVPVLVAALPLLEEDESGGDSRRVLRTLQARVARDGVYVVVDSRGWMDLASVGVPLDLSIPYSLMTPRSDDRSFEEQAKNPGPPSWASVPERLEQIVAVVGEAGPGEPNGIVDDLRPLAELRPDYASDRLREDTIFLSVAGAVVGLTAAAVVLGVLRAIRRGDRPAPAPAGGPRRPGGRQRRGGGRRRGRRGGGRRA
jgi:hypothetical protein